MKESQNVKIVVFVPESYADKMKEAMSDAGAGVIGNYTFCFSSSKSTGQFRPEQSANPTIGEVGKLESVDEIRIETLCDRDKLENVVEAISKVHPYDEAPIDIYPMLEI